MSSLPSFPRTPGPRSAVPDAGAAGATTVVPRPAFGRLVAPPPWRVRAVGIFFLCAAGGSALMLLLTLARLVTQPQAVGGLAAVRLVLSLGFMALTAALYAVTGLRLVDGEQRGARLACWALALDVGVTALHGPPYAAAALAFECVALLAVITAWRDLRP